MVPKRTTGQTCPLCGGTVQGPGLAELGKHFRSCPKTDRARVGASDGE